MPNFALVLAMAVAGAMTFPGAAAAAKMTREQAQIACRNEVPHVPKGDRGGSRGINTGNSAMQECIKSKMSGK